MSRDLCFVGYAFRNNHQCWDIALWLLPIRVLNSKPFSTTRMSAGYLLSPPLIPLYVPLVPWGLLGPHPYAEPPKLICSLRATGFVCGPRTACGTPRHGIPCALVLVLGLNWIFQPKLKRGGFLKRSFKKWKPRQYAICPNTKWTWHPEMFNHIILLLFLMGDSARELPGLNHPVLGQNY